MIIKKIYTVYQMKVQSFHMLSRQCFSRHGGKTSRKPRVRKVEQIAHKRPTVYFRVHNNRLSRLFKGP